MRVRLALFRRGGGGCLQTVCVDALQELALPRVTLSGEIALAGLRRLRSMPAAAPLAVLFVHAVITVVETK